MSSLNSSALTPTSAPASLDPLLVALPSAMPMARQAWGSPRRQKLKGRFLGLKEFQKALPIQLARGAILHPIHQGFRFSRTRFERFEALDELIHQDLRFFRTGPHRFEVLDKLLSHDHKHPCWGHDSV
jgi:hypothetical protein